MKADFSRQTFVQEKHYNDVLAQQGRMLLDAEVNESGAIRRYRDATEAADIIGGCGYPKAESKSFEVEIQGTDNLLIKAGRYYVAGKLAENEGDVTYDMQPDLPQLPDAVSVLEQLTNAGAAVGLVYLEVFDRLITSIDDPRLLESAVGIETADRSKLAWQVRVLPLPSANAATATCASNFPELSQMKPSTGKMDAQVAPGSSSTDPCLPMPSTGLQSLENQLYRIEVFQGGDRSNATIKWSRNNGSIVTQVTQMNSPTLLTVASLGVDDVLGFANDNWVEISTDAIELNSVGSSGSTNTTGFMTKITVDPTHSQVTLPAPGLDGRFTGVDPTKSTVKMRLWDMDSSIDASNGIPMTSADAAGGWIDLGSDGIQVTFKPGQYNAGDYWIFPARAQLGAIEWPPYGPPGPQTPMGIQIDWCPLALIGVGDGGLVTIGAPGPSGVAGDCRKPFPTLTGICAEDVCFDDSICSMNGVATVQDALNKLCQEQNLKFHNQHLHGWGVVCGLQVDCGIAHGGTNTQVSVQPGYALDCSGDDVQVTQAETLEIIDMLAAANSAQGGPILTGDGEVYLQISLDETSQPVFGLDKFTPPANKMQELLQGGIWMDIYNDCLLPIVNFWKSETTPQAADAGQLVGPTAERLITLLNLIIQLFNQTNGQYVFLSSAEDTILRNFYTQLKSLLQSETFCAMFDNARPFPDYPSDLEGPVTIFGKNFQSRVRSHPTAQIVYSVGANDKINVYDTAAGQMIAEVQFTPGGADCVVQDVVVSPDGSQLYAVAVTNSNNTVFATATIVGTTYTWNSGTTICGVQLVTLQTQPGVLGTVYAIGKGLGLFVIDPANVPTNGIPSLEFNAVGQMVIGNLGGMGGPTAFATSSTVAGSTSQYDSFVRISLASNTILETVPLRDNNGAAVVGNDDIGLYVDPTEPIRQFGIVTEPTTGSNKQLFLYNTDSGEPFPSVVDLGYYTAIHLAPDIATRVMAVTYADEYMVGIVDVVKQSLVPQYRLPVQINPTSITYVAGSANQPSQQQIVVLNETSNTLTVFSAANVAAGISPALPADNAALSTYRTGILEAFSDLLGGFLQYLKDCFCHHLLVNCPSCDTDTNKLYLGAISIRNNTVYKVCNFTGRRFVVSFPTLGYWLSTVPIIPAIREVFEKFCCASIMEYFSKYSPPSSPSAPNKVSAAALHNSVRYGQSIKYGDLLATGTARYQVGKQLVGGFTSDKLGLAQPAPTNQITPPNVGFPVNKGLILGLDTNTVSSTLQNNGIRISDTREFNANIGAQNLAPIVAAPSTIQPGQSVTLYTENGVVKYYSLAAPLPPEVQDLQTQVNTQQTEITAVPQLQQSLEQAQAQITAGNTQITNLQGQLQTEIQNRTALQTQLAQNATEFQTMQATLTAQGQAQTQLQASLAERDQQITALNTQITAQSQSTAAQLQAALAQRDQTIAGLTTQVQSLTTQQATLANTATQLATLQTQVAQLHATLPNLGNLPKPEVG